ncbi:MAG: hypothetical protein R2883_04370 [Caldisericia bacterium]
MNRSLSKRFATILIVLSVIVFGIIGCRDSNEDKTKYDSHSLRIAKRLMGWGSSFNAGPINGANHEGLAEIITNTKKDFDSKNGEVDAHKANLEIEISFLLSCFKKLLIKIVDMR